MVQSKMFDNLFKLIKSSHENVVAAIDTTEIDLELPRGFIAKIKKVIFTMRQINSSGLASSILETALLRDPDDITTTLTPQNSVEHDVIAELNANIIETAGASGYATVIKTIEFDQELDVVSARNLRHNARCGSNPASIDCEVYYTLEAVTSDLLLNLLDIL